MNLKLKRQYEAAITGLASAISAYVLGHVESYRDVADHLDRMLIGSLALWPRVYRAPHLHRMEGLAFQEGEMNLPLDEWLEQKPNGLDQTLRELIQSAKQPDSASTAEGNAVLIAVGEYLLRLYTRQQIAADLKGMLSMAKEAHADAGRGAFVTGSSQFAQDFKGALDIHWVPAANILGHFQFADEAGRAGLATHLDGYDPATEFSVCIQNLTGSISYYLMR